MGKGYRIVNVLAVINFNKHSVSDNGKWFHKKLSKVQWFQFDWKLYDLLPFFTQLWMADQQVKV